VWAGINRDILLSTPVLGSDILSAARWFVVNFSCTRHILTDEELLIKVIALYTLKTLCFSSIVCPINDQIVERYNGHRKGLRSSLMLVACLWAAVGLIVTFNIAANGSYHFYGPTGFCTPLHISCTSHLDMAQGVGFNPSTRSSVLLRTSFSCG
jgi:hypothetical protein